MAADTASQRPHPDIVLRRPRFDLDGRDRRPWLGGDVAATALWDAFSVLLPSGERFFIRSVNHFRTEIVDPRLKGEVDAFMAQEATHARAHRQWNEGLAAEGHDVAHLEAPVARMLAWVATTRERRVELAVTCAIEHFTAMLAEQLLRDPSLLAAAQPRHARLWFWHAVEETEHKAVAYDVMTLVVADSPPWRRYWFRASVYLLTTLLFNAVWFTTLHRLLAIRPWRRRLASWLGITWYLWGRPGLYRRCFVDYCRYLRPGFHPWQRDSSALLDRWRPTLRDAGAASP
jgi:hypothetical protein